MRWRGEAVYFVIFNFTNVLNYVYLLFVGFFLGVDSYGLFGALFGVVYLASALGNMVKMAVARHVATVQAQNGGAVTRQVVMAVIGWSAGFAAIVGLVLVPAVPFMADAFDSPTAPVAWSCVAIALSIWVPAAYGVLQGLERFPWLGAALLFAALVRIAVGGALVAAGAGVSGAMAGVAIGFAGGAVVALVLSLSQAQGRTDGRPWIGVPLPRPGALLTVLVAGIVVTAPTSLDVAVVRHVFSGEEAGVYTGIAVLGRAVIFATVAVPFTVLPKVAARTATGSDTSRLLWDSLAITGTLAVAAAAAIVFVVDVLGWAIVGADVSGAAATLHWYLGAMVLFSLTVTVIYYQVGKGDGSFILLAGAPGVVLQGVLVTLVPASITGVAELLFAVNAVLLVSGLLFATVRVPAASSARRGHPLTASD